MGQIELFNHLLYLKLFNCFQTNDLIWIISIAYQYLEPFYCV